MKTIRVDLPETLTGVELHVLSDLHIGDSMSDSQLIQKALNHILETPNAVCVLGGDLMDTAIASSVGDTYGANLQPMEQLKLCVKLFRPLADAGKIVALVPGNHENRVYRSDGLDMTGIMAAQLGLQDRYSPTTALLFLRLGRNDSTNHHRKIAYSVYVTHGSGGGRKEGGKINRLVDYAQIVDADAYICGHTHLPAVLRTSYYRVCMSNSSVQLVDKVYVNTASWLSYGGYGDSAGFKPASKRNPVLYFSGEKHEVTVIA
jgi:UDP-2,3-diacylglucosamine pyrophosphatase LpxH